MGSTVFDEIRKLKTDTVNYLHEKLKERLMTHLIEHNKNSSDTGITTADLVGLITSLAWFPKSMELDLAQRLAEASIPLSSDEIVETCESIINLIEFLEIINTQFELILALIKQKGAPLEEIRRTMNKAERYTRMVDSADLSIRLFHFFTLYTPEQLQKIAKGSSVESTIPAL